MRTSSPVARWLALRFLGGRLCRLLLLLRLPTTPLLVASIARAGHAGILGGVTADGEGLSLADTHTRLEGVEVVRLAGRKRRRRAGWQRGTAGDARLQPLQIGLDFE